jgi:serine/threonine protein kinase
VGWATCFLAEDTTLERHVALKTLPPELAGDADRRARLAREAKAIAALNHPNIVTVYSVERVGDIDFIRMELVQGRSLAELLPRTGFALDRFFEIAIPLVDAVAAAHQQGIMHRDLKPGNVMVSDEGRVKVLDFGLARGPRGPVDAGAATITASPTLEGHVVGTPAYMSPEQAEGRVVDTRSDIFSLGVLLYEMLTGRRPFIGDTPTSTIASIVKEAPRPIGELNMAIPRDVSRAVHRCLAKNPIDRYQTAVDLRHDLADAKQELSGRQPQGHRPQDGVQPDADGAAEPDLFPALAVRRIFRMKSLSLSAQMCARIITAPHASNRTRRWASPGSLPLRRCALASF